MVPWAPERLKHKSKSTTTAFKWRPEEVQFKVLSSKFKVTFLIKRISQFFVSKLQDKTKTSKNLIFFPVLYTVRKSVQQPSISDLHEDIMDSTKHEIEG